MVNFKKNIDELWREIGEFKKKYWVNCEEKLVNFKEKNWWILKKKIDVN